MRNEEKFKKAVMEAWDMYMEPLFNSGDLVFECSDRLRVHLLKIGSGEYSDEEVMKLMDDGEV